MTNKTLAVYNAVAAIVGPLYLVGGAVRDTLLGVEPHDYDFTTDLLPNEIEARVRAAGRKPYLTGARWGTVGFKVEVDGEFLMVEVTTFRAEKYTENNRHPQVIYVQDITADLARRDFTVNAMAFGKRGKLIDPFGGEADLEAGVLKAVGMPSHRFREDPVRLLRLARFTAKLNFAAEERTLKQAKDLSYKILTTTHERWMIEMDKLLVEPYIVAGLNMLAETRLLNYMLPELALQVGYDQNTPHHDFTLWDHTCKVVAAMPPDATLRWAALLHDVAKPATRTERPDRSNFIKHDLLGAEMVNKIALYLKWSTQRKELVSSLVRDHLTEESPLKAADSGAQKRKVAT
jgi:putative nucleotidyltransferase with HDIG domain